MCACFRDPNGTTLAFADMMKKQVVMPAHMMDDMVHKGRTGRNIFQDFSTVAESTGTYTAQVSRHDKALLSSNRLNHSGSFLPRRHSLQKYNIEAGHAQPTCSCTTVVHRCLMTSSTCALHDDVMCLMS